MSERKTFYFVKCIPDGTYLAKPAMQGKFTRDDSKRAPLTRAEAKKLGFCRGDDPIYALEIVDQRLINPPKAVAFNPLAGATSESSSTNGERAKRGHRALALYVYALMHDSPSPFGHELDELVKEIDLTEAPEEAMSGLLDDLMHYCHRDGVEFYGEEGGLGMAMKDFNVESGGAAL